MGFFNKKKKTKKQSPSKPKTPQPKPNKWRAEEGVDEPLRVGRGIRTRDEFFAGQEGKDVHPEIDKRELYRRSVVLDIDDEQNLAVTKVHTFKSTNYPSIPNDAQKRRYERKIQTASGTNAELKPIRIEKDKFELAPSAEDVTEEQAKFMLDDIEKSSQTNRKRLQKFQNKKKAGS